LYFIVVHAFTTIIKGVSNVGLFVAAGVFLFVVMSIILGFANTVISRRICGNRVIH